MNLNIKDRFFIITGAGSGFGKAITRSLLEEGARVLAVTRTAKKLEDLAHPYLEILEADVWEESSIQKISGQLNSRIPDGIVINAGGPPAKAALETSIEDWDNAYRLLLRWKIQLTQMILPGFTRQSYGRILYIESASVKQPMENLVLSTAFRLSVVGYAKTLSQEVASKGITVNVLAPGLHDTAAVDRIFRKQAEQAGISYEQAKEKRISDIPVHRMGRPEEFASLALWLLSPLSGFITGETISVDGGSNASIFG